MGAIKINNLNKRLGEFTLSIDKLNIESGYITGFIGPNGAGKTTTIRTIMGMLKDYTGEVSVLGKDPRKDVSIREEIGYVGDVSGYLQEGKIKDIKNVVCKFYSKWDDEVYNRYIKQFKLEENKLYKDLSKGQKKQFDLAIALAHHPKLIIMDEPTANLDPLVRDEILEILQEFMEKEDATIFYSSHITSDLEKAADFIVMIYEGRIILTGEKGEIQETHFLVKGKGELLTEEIKKELIGSTKGTFGFEGLTNNKDRIYELLGEEAVYERANLEEILKYYTRGNK